MGQLVNGVWTIGKVDTSQSGGKFVRSRTSFREWTRADGSTAFSPAVGRYHLYASLACPWAHRVMIVRLLDKLEQAISISIVRPLMLDDGWEIDPADPGPVAGVRYLHEIYTRADSTYTGRVTVPVLWDTHTDRIVNNESSDLIRMLDSEWNDIGDASIDLYPEALRADIDALNRRIYETVNDGVYRAGFASTQAAHDEAVDALFDTLEWLEDRLRTRQYLCGDRITEADWRLFTTLVRFDPVYVGHFKCNKRRLIDYPNLLAFTERLYAVPGVRATCDMEHIKLHYYGSHTSLNPKGIVPKGPARWLD